MAILHCGKPSKVLETRGNERVRECAVCGEKFRTEEVLKEIITKPQTVTERREKIQRTLILCPISRDELKHMMDTYSTINSIARELKCSVTTLNRWMREFDL